MRYCLCFIFFCTSVLLQAQNVTRHNIDSLKHADSLKHSNHFDSSIFSDANTLTASDYLLAIEKMQETLNQVPLVTSSFDKIPNIQKNLIQADSAINVIKQGLSFDTRVLSLRNIQMFQTLIDNLQQSNDKYLVTINAYDDRLDALKKNILNIRRDTVLRHLFRDSALRKSFAGQLKPIHLKWEATDTLVKKATFLINKVKTQASENDIVLKELDYQTDMRLQQLGPRVFTKEVPFIWQPIQGQNSNILLSDYKKSSDNLSAAARYYFINTRSQRMWLLIGGIIFFYWIYFNFLSIKKRNKREAVAVFHFIFVNPLPIATSFIVMLTLAPLMDLNAPAIYLESVQFVLMIILTGVFWRRWPRTLFYGWCIVIGLFLLVPLGNLFNLPFTAQRWLMLVDDGGACLFGLYFFRHIKGSDLRIRPNLLTAAGFYLVFNFAAVVTNIFGRLTLTKILGSTAVYGFAQMISLNSFCKNNYRSFFVADICQPHS